MLSSMDVTFVENQSLFPNTYLQRESLGEDKFLSYGMLDLPRLSESLPLVPKVSPIGSTSLSPSQEPSSKLDQGGVNATACHYRFTLGINSPDLIECKLKSLNPSQVMNTQTPLILFPVSFLLLQICCSHQKLIISLFRMKIQSIS